MTPHEITEAGLKAHQAGRLGEAESLYQAALSVRSDFYPALHLMGMIAFTRQDLVAAEEWFSRAIAAAPAGHAVTALAGRGEVFLQLERWQQALSDFEAVLAVDARLAATWNNRGLALNKLGRFDEALGSYARACALSPESSEIYNNRGDTLRELRRFDLALASFEHALKPNSADWRCLHNRAVALEQMGRPDDALRSYGQALELHPNNPATLYARANLLWRKKRMLGQALADADHLVAMAPDFAFARGSRMQLAMTAARWDNFETEKEKLDMGVRAGRPVTEPFSYLFVSDRPEDMQRCARIFSAARFPAQPPMWKGGARKPGRIRVGYVCGEFRAHATLYLTVGLFESHDRGAFEVFAFDSGEGDGSPLRARFERAVEHLSDVRHLSDREAASKIRALDLDILVDLNGYTDNLRPGIFAHRPARVQVSYLAYPGTLGAPYIDYILADRVLIPQDEERYYDEKLACLPCSYQVNDHKRVVAETPTRGAVGLPAGVFVFCNFNHIYKLTPDTFSLWLRILKQVPDSILWLLKPDAIAEENLKREAALRDVDPQRLVFAGHQPFDKHLARLKLGDLFLDGSPCGAHTTASDALWSGLPLITCRGSSFAGRVASSLLFAMGLPELVADDAAHFETLALQFAKEPRRLAAIRQKLAKNRDTATLFDTETQARTIETAWRMMLDRPTPESFVVPA